jgi:hypothetical protein
MFAASGGTTSSEFIVFPHSPTPRRPHVAAKLGISRTTLERFDGGGYGTGPNPKGSGVGAAHGGASPCPKGLTEEMTSMIRTSRIATDFATELSNGATV